jgi:hypothetical protein
MPFLEESGHSFSNYFNAKAQRREGANHLIKHCVFASLRLCVKNEA